MAIDRRDFLMAALASTAIALVPAAILREGRINVRRAQSLSLSAFVDGEWKPIAEVTDFISTGLEKHWILEQ